MAYRVIHLIDSEAGNYQWPFKLGQWVWSKTHCIAATIVGGWFEVRSFGRRQEPFQRQKAFKCSTGLRRRTGVNSPNRPRIWNPVQETLCSTG